MDYPKSDPKVGLHNGKFTDGSADGTVPPSLDPASWANAVTDEILNVIMAGGLTPNENQFDQLVTAIRALTPAATDTVAGKVELATVAEAAAGTDTTKAVTPAGVAAAVAALASSPPDATTAVKGMVQLATNAEASAMAAANKALTPANLAALFARSHAASGYQKLPGGLMVQWGTTGSITHNTGAAIIWPIAFTKAVASVQATPIGSVGLTAIGTSIALSGLTGMTLYHAADSSQSFAYRWIAVGY